ncbi:uncharacterized protein [Choristoneura fumiferana]|uniref:uncharacterized protein n=1 Tax=Choristoneura fumiferana TaxID=7141 RepID=UPI003D1588FC
MFLRIQIRPQDQDALRFLWRNNPTEPVKTYVMTSLIFGAKCSPFVAQFIKNKNARRYESSSPAAVSAICDSHYADDYIQSLPDEAAAIDMVKEVTEIHRAGGFEIRNWTSNSLSVVNSVPKETLGAAAVKFKIDQQLEGERTLGLIWFPATDELGFDVSFKRIPDDVIQGTRRPTKRLMLRVVMSVFDVFGFLSPFTIQGRIMLQDTWRLNIGWDDFLPDVIHKKWCRWLDLLKVVGTIRLPRWYAASRDGAAGVSEMEHQPVGGVAGRPPLSPATRCYDSITGDGATRATKPQASVAGDSSYNNLQLHLFSDASLQAMSAVAYLRWNNKGKILMAFVASKARAAPLKATTVPRLELQAAVLAARLADAVGRELKLPIARRYFWCDSSTVLHWLNNNTRSYKTFEANRLGEIDDLTNLADWRYVPTALNVADIATRDAFKHDSLLKEWLNGPSFLYDDESRWPLNILEPENKETFKECINVVLNLPAEQPVPDPERFSSWLRYLRSAVAVLKFINICRGIRGDECALMERAELLVLRQAQAESFGGDIATLRAGKCLPRESRLLTLSPYLDDDGVLRVGGRIDAALDVPLETRRPVILDGKHPTARLLVKHYHIKAAHGNQEAVVNDVKQRYWVIRLRPTVKNVVSRCMFCRLRKAKPEPPRMGDLPAARVAHHQRPFTHCGVDLFGPMEVVVGRRREKRYGVLFTCLTVRAIHIELVHSLTTDSMIMALRRMASRRGWPRHIYSDNGTNLRGSDTELKRAVEDIDDEALKAEAVNNGAHWSFIPPASPHWGGAWERLIRSVKTSLRVILKERAPRDEVLATLLAEVEGMVNGRPLTHVSVEPGSSEALTPNHFLLGSSAVLPTLGSFDDSDLFLRKQWRKAQRLADMYWRRWVREYLPQLLPRSKWQRERRGLRVGDLVLVADPAAPRNGWPRGLVQRVTPGRDGRVRLVEVRTAGGVLRRSAQRVAPVPMGDEC